MTESESGTEGENRVSRTQPEGGFSAAGELAPASGPILATWVGELPLKRWALTGLGLGLLAKSINYYPKERREFRDRQKRYWKDIVDEKALFDYGIVDGGGVRASPDQQPPFDQVYGKTPPLPGLYALFRTMRPIIGEALARSAGASVQEFARLVSIARSTGLDGAETRETIQSLIAKADIKLGLARHLSTSDRQLLVTLGGVVSNSFVEEFLLTLPRRYHTVVYLPEEGKHRPLDNHDVLESLRGQLRQSTSKGRPKDANFQYEIWRSEEVTCKNVRLDSPVIRPHEMTDDHIYDGIHVTVAQKDTDEGKVMVFAAQSLHSFGTVASDLFFRPEALLGAASDGFADKARCAMSGAPNGGFEAVLQVKRRRRKSDHSPTNFVGIPDIGRDTKVTILVDPVPL